jgi:hypothetical protein
MGNFFLHYLHNEILSNQGGFECGYIILWRYCKKDIMMILHYMNNDGICIYNHLNKDLKPSMMQVLQIEIK